MDIEPRVLLPELRPRLREDGFGGLGRAQGGLIGGRPELARPHIAEIDKGAPAIARGILPPTGDRQLAPAAVAAAGTRDGHMVAAVGQQMHFGGRWRRVGEDAHHAFAAAGEHLRRFRRQVFDEHARGGLGHPLLQQQVRGLEHRTGQEPPLQGPVVQDVHQGQQAHALMVHHEGPDGGARFVGSQPRRRVVDRLIEPIGTGASLGRQALEVLACGDGCDHQRERRRIGRDDHVLAQAALQSQAGHAEGAVLVVELHVGPVVAGLGNAPRHAERLAVSDLLLHRGAAGVVEERVLVVRHDQQRHQVFEHRAAPGDEDRLSPGGDEQASHREPMVLRNLPQRDGDIAAQARFRGQQIVEAGVRPALTDVEPGAKQIPLPVEEEKKIHRGQFVAVPREGFQREQALPCVVAGLMHAARKGGAVPAGFGRRTGR